MAQMEMSTEAAYIIAILLVKFELRNTLSLGAAYNELVTTSTRLQRAIFSLGKDHFGLTSMLEKFAYNEYHLQRADFCETSYS